jgi:protein tyrosine phosphatase (PTP) superfamily phosphohydrolase (DUF442 family)
MATADIKNFVPITDRLGTAGQPKEDELPDIVDEGYEVVVNISTNDSEDCPPDEEGAFVIQGVEYHHIPVIWTEPTVEDFDAFVRIMDDVAGRKIFVHCAANYRVSVFTALYGQLRWKWSEQRADAHIAALWQPNETWSSYIADVRLARCSEA